MDKQVDKLERLLARVQHNRRLPRVGAPAFEDAAERAEVAALAGDVFATHTRVAPSTHPPPAAVPSQWPGARGESLEDAHPSFDESISGDSGLRPVTEPSIDIEVGSAVEMHSGVEIHHADPVAVDTLAADGRSLPPEELDASELEPAITVPPEAAADQRPVSMPTAAITAPPRASDSLFPEHPTVALDRPVDGMVPEPLILAKPAAASGPVARIVGKEQLEPAATFGELLRRSLGLRAR